MGEQVNKQTEWNTANDRNKYHDDFSNSLFFRSVFFLCVFQKQKNIFRKIG